MNGVVIEQMSSLEDAVDADAVIVGSGIATREVVEDATIMNTLRRLDPQRQLIAGQCSGTLVLAKLGLLNDVPACTDLTTKPLGHRRRCRGAQPAVLRQGQRRDRRRPPGLALPRGVDHHTPRWQVRR
jgi:hypothetical protein